MKRRTIIFLCLCMLCFIAASAQNSNKQEQNNDFANEFSEYLHLKVDYYLDQYHLRQYIPKGPYLVMGSKPNNCAYFADLTIVARTDSLYTTYTKWYSKEDIYFDCIAIDNPDIEKLFNIPSKVEYINEPISGQWTGYSYYIALYDEKHHLIYEINRYRKILDPTTNEPDNTYQISYNNLFIFYLADRMGLVR